jgi:hypothetical protein
MSGPAEPWHGTKSTTLVGCAQARSVFKYRPGLLFHRARPNSLKQKFFIYSNSLRFVKYQINPSIGAKLSKLWMIVA